MRVVVVLVVVAAFASVVLLHRRPPSPPRQAERFTLQFGWIPDAHQSGFWVALDKGYYSAVGLDVSLLPGGLDASPVKAIVSGTAQMGQAGGLEQVVTAVSEGLPVKAVAAIQRDTPHALISLSRAPIRKASDMEGKRIAVAHGDAAEVLLDAFIAKSGVNRSKVKFEPFRFDLKPLISGQVDAVTGFSTDQPATLKSQGLSPVTLSYSTAGIRSYGYTLICTDAVLAAKQQAVAKFLAASRQGWEYAFAHPDEACAVMARRFLGKLTDKVEREKVDLIRPLMCSTDGKLAEWQLDPRIVADDCEYLRQEGQIARVPRYEDIVAALGRR